MLTTMFTRTSSGPRMRKEVAREVLYSEHFQDQLKLLAEKLGRPLADVHAEAEKGLREIAAVKSPIFSRLFDHVLGPMHTRAWTLDVDLPGLRRVKEFGEQGKALVFLPTHRSYADPFLLTQALRENGFPRNHILGGDNLGFFPLGMIIRRSGGVLMRRSFKGDEVYKLVVSEYLRYLVVSGSNLEWYMEGGRSRTGKLRPPKYGLLRYLADAIMGNAAEDLMLVPVSITYDQLHEIGALAAEETGLTKAKEGVHWLMDYAKTQKNWIGKTYVRFGEPLSLRKALLNSDLNKNGGRLALGKIAFEVFQRINRATPVTAPALVTLALLGARDLALTLNEIHGVVAPILAYASLRGLPTTAISGLGEMKQVEEVLNALVRNGVIYRYDHGLTPVFKIAPGKHSVAAFYRNSAIHWFINRAIVELGVIDATRDAQSDSLERGWDAAYAIRDLLKFEFFFSNKQTFHDEIKAEALLVDPDFVEHLVCPQQRSSILKDAPFLIAHRVLPAFLEAYFIVADRLVAQSTDTPLNQKAFLSECISVGQQYVLQGRLHNPECVSRELFSNALSLAANRNLLEPGPADLAERRRKFAEETSAAVAAVDAIERYDRQLRAAEKEST